LLVIALRLSLLVAEGCQEKQARLDEGSRYPQLDMAAMSLDWGSQLLHYSRQNFIEFLKGE
jgi:hypothetical protein